MLALRVARYLDLLRPGALSWALAALEGLRRVAVELHELDEVHIIAKGPFDGLQIGLVAVCGELDAVGEAGLSSISAMADWPERSPTK